ncbi:MAG: hypothetical protein LUF78_08245 [Clostridiales bacterium]|nr:hypothetical protein [Clostridiales bacterium]
MNPKKKPDYDPEEILRSLMDAAVEIYTEKNSLHAVADELELNVIKVRKLLITAGAYQSDTAEDVSRLQKDGKTISEIMSTLHLSKSSVNSYLPYTKIPYKADELSLNAERIKKYRERRTACEKLAEEGGMDNLWNCLIAFQGYLFSTAKGLKFKYEIHGGEMKVDRKEKTVTRSSVEVAYKKALEGGVTGPKKLGVFGASYLYPVFVRIGVIENNMNKSQG